MSPILVRPVREQLEHDRIIRLLHPRYRRRFNVGLNVGAELRAPVGEGRDALYPDLVLTPTGRGRKIVGVVEVETGESVNNLEAIAQWARFGRLPLEFALYVPAGSVDVTKRLCADHQIGVTEIWTYHMIGDQFRFTQVHRAPIELKIATARAAAAPKVARRTKPKPAPHKRAAAPRPAKASQKPGARKPAARVAARAKASKPAAKKPARTSR